MSSEREFGPIAGGFRVANLGIFVGTKIWRFLIQSYHGLHYGHRGNYWSVAPVSILVV
jgi:hypothetical protein